MPGQEDLCFAGLTANARRLRAREITSVQLSQAFLDRIDALEARTGAYARLMRGSAMDEAIRAFSYTVPFNVTGSPSITFPVGPHEGLPLAAQLVGRHFEEEAPVRAGGAYQSATDWHLRRPPLD